MYPHNVPGNKIVFPDVLNASVVPVHVYPRNVPANISFSPAFLQAAKKEKKEKREAVFPARQAALLAAHQGVRQDPPSPKGPPLLTQPEKADKA